MILTILALASAAPSAPADDTDDKVRCIREDIIGSLAGQGCVSHTLGEWRAIQSRASAEVYRTIQLHMLNLYNRDPKPAGV